MKKKVFISALLTLALTACCSFASVVSAFAEHSHTVAVDKSGEFAGVNLTTAAGGSLVVSGDGRTEATAKDVVVTYEIGSLEKNVTNGVAFRVDKGFSTADLSPRFLLESSDGVLYRLFYNANDKYVSADGTVTDTSAWKQNVTFTATRQTDGTFFVPWGSVNATGTKMPYSEVAAEDVPQAGTAVPSGTVFTKFHFVVQTRTASQFQPARATAICEIASVRKNADNPEKSEVVSLLDPATLVYSVNAEDKTADVNLADMKNGTKIYSKYTSTGTFVIDEDETALSALQFTRSDAALTVLCTDGNGNEVAESFVVKVPFDKARGVFPFDITEQVKTLNGYKFNADKSDALTGEITGNAEAVLAYDMEEGPKLTERYLDKSGNEIAASTLAKVVADGTGYKYECSPKKIFGYKYSSADKDLSGAITEDGVITYTYNSAAIKDYDAIKDENGDFVGINIKNPTMGTVMIVGTNTGKATAELSMTTFELGAVSTADADGLLIKIDRTVAAGNQIPRLLLEDENGFLYKFGERYLREDVFILPDGTVSVLENDSFHYNMDKEIEGTLFIPWKILTTTGTAMPYATEPAPEGNLRVAGETVFTKFHFCLDSRATSWQGVDRPTGIGTIAAVSFKGEKIVTEELIDPATLKYSYDEADDTADVNIAKPSLGKKVYISHSITGSFIVDGSVSDKEQTLAAVELKRLAASITLNFVDENGKIVKTSSTVQAEYTDEGATYEIEPPTIVGYEFVSADKPLSGAADGALTITLTYTKKAIKVTVKYTDEAGNSIKEDKIIVKFYGDYLEIDPETETIEGYTYEKSEGSLKVTLVSDKTVTLIYTKDKTGGCGSNISGGEFAVYAVIAAGALATVFLLKRKKEN